MARKAGQLIARGSHTRLIRLIFAAFSTPSEQQVIEAPHKYTRNDHFMQKFSRAQLSRRADSTGLAAGLCAHDVAPQPVSPALSDFVSQ